MADSKTITELSDALNRGDVDGALEAVGLPRRAFLTGLAAMVPAATGTSAAAAALPSDDAKLVDCARRIAVLREKEKVTAAESARTYKIYEEIKPAKPRALLWRVGDPVDYLRGQAYQFKENGKTYL
jgi:hypothetical protein